MIKPFFKSDQGTYTYAQPGKTNPHAVTKIDDGKGKTTEFTYDSSGRRLSKTVSDYTKSETTWYPFADYEIEPDGKTKTSISANN